MNTGGLGFRAKFTLKSLMIFESGTSGGFAKLISMSKVPSKYLKCPTCHRIPDYPKLESILSDAMAYRDNIPFDPKDPIVISETEVYCSAECYVIAVLSV